MLFRSINIGNPREFTIRQLAEKVNAMIGNAMPLHFHDLPVNDPMQRRPDIRKAQDLLGWEPHIDLDQGLSRTIAYFRNLIEAKALA